MINRFSNFFFFFFFAIPIIARWNTVGKRSQEMLLWYYFRQVDKTDYRSITLREGDLHL